MRSLRKRLRDQVVFAFVRVLLVLGGRLPRYGLAPLASGLVRMGLPLLAKPVTEGERSLRAALPEAGARERMGLLRRSASSLVLSALELFSVRAGRNPLSYLSGTEGLETVEAALARGKGVVHVTAHLGNWELLVLIYARLGYAPFAVRQRLKDPRYDALLDEFHARHGVGLLRRGGSAMGAFRVLARGGVLGILADMDTDVDSVEVPFFGRSVRAPVGPVVLARRAGAALIPAFLTRDSLGGHRLKIGAEIRLEGKSDREAVAAYTAAIELAVRENPGQWSWFHKRFSEAAPVGG